MRRDQLVEQISGVRAQIAESGSTEELEYVLKLLESRLQILVEKEVFIAEAANRRADDG